MSSKRPKLDHQRTAMNDNIREETPASVVEYEYTGSDHHVPNNMTHVRIHPTVTKIESWSFHNRRSLKEVVFNEGLVCIGMNAFCGCTALQSINIPSTVIEIDHDAFRSCTGLKEVVLNEGLTIIGSSAFHDCKSLQSITIPSTVDEISMTVFIRCNSLREVVLSDGLKKIAGHSFQSCTSLQSITIPSTVDEIGSSAFYSCTDLQDVVLNERTKRIKISAFAKCTSLRSIKLPSAVIEIDRHAFRDCLELREVVIHNEEVQIGDYAFENCSSLERFKFQNHSLLNRLDNIIQAGQRGIEAKLDDIPGLEWRGGELSVPTVHRPSYFGAVETIAMVDKEKLDKIKGLISYYEMKEATTLFELALWKAKIDQADISNADRAACRVEVPGPVKDTILQYLRR